MRAERRLGGAALAALLLLLWAPPAAAQFCVTAADPEGAAEPEGTGGTGRAGGDGIGGTGAPAPRGDEPGGIGGTGLWSSGDDDGVGGTGIEGTITGFGSLCVNGLRIGYDDTTVVMSDGAAISAARLRRGDVVRIAAERRGAALHARSIELRHEVVGPVGRVDVASGVMEVLGQRVRLGADTRFDDAAATAGAARPLAEGDFVRVSGLRRGDGEIAASRVERTPPDPEVGVTGTIEAREAGVFAIGVREFALEPGVDEPIVGRRARVCGRLEGERLVAHEVEIDPDVPFRGAVETVSLEGFAHAVPGTRRLELGGVVVELSDLPEVGDDVVQGLQGATRARVGGRLAPDGSVRAERLEIAEHEGAERIWRSIERGGRWRERRDRDDLGESLLEDVEPFEQIERSGREERAERPEREERVERPERIEREERPERPEREERPERPERPEDDD